MDGLAYRSRSVSNVSWATLNPGEPTKSAIRQCKALRKRTPRVRVLIGFEIDENQFSEISTRSALFVLRDCGRVASLATRGGGPFTRGGILVTPQTLHDAG